MTSEILNAPSGTFNNVGANQYNIYNSTAHYASAAPAISPAQHSFNDAAIDLLSVHFTGRKKELALIARAFKQQRSNMPLRCVLFGNQGVGKSQLTYEWARSTFGPDQNSYILWISATTVEKLCQGFCRLLHLVNHPDRSHPEQSARLTAARRWLEKVDTGNWLLVLDNVFPDTLDFLRQHLPRQNGRGSILFTTRSEHVAIALASAAGKQHEVIEVPLLDVKDSVELFLGHFNDGEIDVPYAKIEEIVKSVGCLPLAISHSTAYMKQSGGTVDDILELYQSKSKFDLISWENSLSEYEHKSVAATFTCQLQDLQRQWPDVSNLLGVLAFFDTESIPLEMLITGTKAIIELQRSTPQDDHALVVSKGHNIRMGKRTTKSPNSPVSPLEITPELVSLLVLIESPTKLRNAITQLQNQSLITARQYTHQSSKLRIHDLIQLVIIENTKRSGVDQKLFEFAVTLACNAFGQIQNHRLPEWWPQCELLVPHIQALTGRQQETSIKVKTLLLQANHRHGRYLEGRGRFVEAEKLYETVVVERKQLFGLEDFHSLNVMHDLARVYMSRGRYNDAEMLFEQVLQTSEKQLGPEHRRTLSTMYQLAQVYDVQGRYNQAEALLKQTLQRQEERFGPGDHGTLSMMHALAHVYSSQEHYDDAAAVFERVLVAKKNRFGPEHVSTLETMHSLGVVYHAQQRHTNAEASLQQVLLARKKQLGLEHHDTLATKHALAIVYHSQGRYDAAMVAFQQVLQTTEKQLGSEHPDTLMTMYCLANVHQSQGQYVKAEALLVHVLAHREEVLGVSHPFTRATIDSLASVYEKLGRFADAEMMKQRAVPPLPANH